MFKRLLKLEQVNHESCFLWGPRQVGKSTYLRQNFPQAKYYDLLNAELFLQVSANPSSIASEILASPHIQNHPVILDEVQKVPILLDEVQRLMVQHGIRFILCGSSARKLKRGGGNLLGGRALRYELFPLIYREIPDFNLQRALNHGLIPRHYLAEQVWALLQAYVGDYLKEEIQAEALTRNIHAFSHFLEAAAISNGEITVYTNVASDCGVKAPTVRQYYQILEDTLLGRMVNVYQKRPKRRVIQAPKFYFFDLGIVNFLLKRRNVEMGNEIFGRAFEHFIFQEIVAHSHYSGIHYPISYWRTASDIEVDFILGNGEIALEIKGVPFVQARHLNGLKAFREEYPRTKHFFVLSLDPNPRLVDGITILPWKTFLENLWQEKYIK